MDINSQTKTSYLIFFSSFYFLSLFLSLGNTFNTRAKRHHWEIDIEERRCAQHIHNFVTSE